MSIIGFCSEWSAKCSVYPDKVLYPLNIAAKKLIARPINVDVSAGEAGIPSTTNTFIWLWASMKLKHDSKWFLRVSNSTIFSLRLISELAFWSSASKWICWRTSDSKCSVNEPLQLKFILRKTYSDAVYKTHLCFSSSKLLCEPKNDSPTKSASTSITASNT